MLKQALEKRLQQTISAHSDTPVCANPGAKLGRWQRKTLIWLLGRYLKLEERGEEVAEPGIQIYLKPYQNRQETLSARAIMSRALQTLEARGLIDRTRRGGGVYLKLTEEGRRIAQPLYDEAKVEESPEQEARD